MNTDRTSRPASASNLSALGWLDASPALRCWFAEWLMAQWRLLCSAPLRTLHKEAFSRAYNGMKAAMRQLGPQLSPLNAEEQFIKVQTAARTCGLAVELDELLFRLRTFLIRYGHLPPHRAALDASPWCNAPAVADICQDRIEGEPAGREGFRPLRAYRGKPHLALAFETVVYQFSCGLQRGITSDLPAGPITRQQLAEALAKSPPEDTDWRLARTVRAYVTPSKNRPASLARFVVHCLKNLAKAGAPLGRQRQQAVVRHFLAVGRDRARLAGSVRVARDQRLQLGTVLTAIDQRPELREGLFRLYNADSARLKDALMALFRNVRADENQPDWRRVYDMEAAEWPALRKQKKYARLELLDAQLAKFKAARGETYRTLKGRDYDSKSSLAVAEYHARRKLRDRHGIGDLADPPSVSPADAAS